MKDLIKALLDVSEAASTDRVRYTIAGPCISITNSEVVIKATDGHLLAEKRLAKPQELEIKTLVDYLVDPESIKLLRYLYTRNNKQSHGWCMELRDGTLYVIFMKHDAIRLTKMDATFPNTDAVKPKRQAHKAVIGINLDLLLKLYKAQGGKQKRSSAHLKLEIGAENEPIIVKNLNSDTYGLLMPIKI